MTSGSSQHFLRRNRLSRLVNDPSAGKYLELTIPHFKPLSNQQRFILIRTLLNQCLVLLVSARFFWLFGYTKQQTKHCFHSWMELRSQGTSVMAFFLWSRHAEIPLSQLLHRRCHDSRFNRFVRHTDSKYGQMEILVLQEIHQNLIFKIVNTPLGHSVQFSYFKSPDLLILFYQSSYHDVRSFDTCFGSVRIMRSVASDLNWTTILMFISCILPMLLNCLRFMMYCFLWKMFAILFLHVIGWCMGRIKPQGFFFFVLHWQL